MPFLIALIFLLITQSAQGAYEAQEEAISYEIPFAQPSGYEVQSALMYALDNIILFARVYIMDPRVINTKKALYLCKNLFDAITQLILLEAENPMFGTSFNNETINEIEKLKTIYTPYGIEKTIIRKRFAIILENLLTVAEIPRIYGCASLEHYILCENIEKKVLEIQSFFLFPQSTISSPL